MAIDRVKVRGRVEVGGISVSTPFIQSFNVTKQRGQPGTFDAVLKVLGGSIGGSSVGGGVRIYAGEGTASNLIFTGICRAAKISPCYDDPKYVILSISGTDVLSLLSGKRYTRRCRSTKSTWVTITGVNRKGLKSGKFAYQHESTLEMDDGDMEKKDSAKPQANVVDGQKSGQTPQNSQARPPRLFGRIISDPTEGGGA